MENKEILTERQIEYLLYKSTGHRYSIASGWGRRWKTETGEIIKDDTRWYYQLMSDGLDDGFFSWYCLERQYNQFFPTLTEAYVYFLKYWFEWQLKQKENRDEKV